MHGIFVTGADSIQEVKQKQTGSKGENTGVLTGRWKDKKKPQTHHLFTVFI